MPDSKRTKSLLVLVTILAFGAIVGVLLLLQPDEDSVASPPVAARNTLLIITATPDAAGDPSAATPTPTPSPYTEPVTQPTAESQHTDHATLPPPLTPVQPPAVIPLPETGASRDHVVVRFDPASSATQRDAYLTAIGATVTGEIAGLDAVTVSTASGSTNDLLLDAPPDGAPVLAQEPDYILTAQIDSTQASDPRYAEQWALPVIAAPEAWAALDQSAPVVRVALIDSGICAGDELRGRYAGGWDYVDDDADPTDEFGHGCAVASIIAANMNDGLGIAGVAPNVQLMPFRVLDSQGMGYYSDAAAAIVRATDSGADIINLSIGGRFGSAVLESAVDYAVSRGVMLVAAGGNTGTESVLYPAAYPGVTGVGAINRDLRRSDFSTTGAAVDLLAPGADILAPDLSGGYRLYTGTSFAAPHVTGVAALEMALGQQLAVTGGIVRAFGASPLGPDTVDYPVPGVDFEPVTFEGIRDGYMMIEGDIIVPENYYQMTALGVYSRWSLWPGGVVPYAFANNTTGDMRRQAEKAMGWWEAAAGVTFVPRSNQYSYVYFTDAGYNASYVGMIRGKQEIWIYNWSFTGVIAHEIGHALGLWHEHTRSDRDQYVTINWGNIEAGRENNFWIQNGSDDYDDGPYDFESIMHYHDTAFSTNGGYTIVAKPGYTQYQHTMGQRGTLSDGDRAAMVSLYGPYVPPATPTPTFTPTFTPSPTYTPQGFEVVTVRESEVLAALQAVQTPPLTYFAVDYTAAEIIIYTRYNGVPAQVTIRFDWYPNMTGLNLVQVTDVNGNPINADYMGAVRETLPRDLALALDAVVESYFDIAVDVDEILTAADWLQIGVVPE